MEIYKDEKRVITVNYGVIKVNTNPNVRVILSDAATTTIIPAEYQGALKKQGADPSDYFVVKGYGGRVCGCFPLTAKDAVEKAIRDYKIERDAPLSPATIARNKVSALFAKAERLIDYPGEYFPARNAARKALIEWQANYPEAAKEEKRSKLLAQAEDLKSKAIGALVYDADGSLTAEYQQKQHDKWMAEAEAKIAEANAL